MRNEGYNYGYQTGGYDSGFGPMPEKKKHSFSTVLIVMLVALLVCLVCYDNIVKPIIETMEKKDYMFFYLVFILPNNYPKKIIQKG